MTLPGFPSMLSAGSGIPGPTEYTTTGTQTVPSTFWGTALTVTIECIGAGGGSIAGTIAAGAGAYSKTLPQSLSGVTGLYLSIPAGGNGASGSDTFVKQNNSSGTTLALAKGGSGGGSTTGGDFSAGTGSTRFSGGNGATGTNAAGGGAGGPSGNGGNASGATPGTSGGSPAGAGGAFGANGNNYGGGGGGKNATNTVGGQGWIRLTFA